MTNGTLSLKTNKISLELISFEKKKSKLQMHGDSSLTVPDHSFRPWAYMEHKVGTGVYFILHHSKNTYYFLGLP